MRTRVRVAETAKKKRERPYTPVCAGCGQTVYALPRSEALDEDIVPYCSEKCVPVRPVPPEARGARTS